MLTLVLFFVVICCALPVCCLFVASLLPLFVLFSVHAPDPVVLQKTFVFPEGIKAMVTTQSKRGITNKHLVLGLVSDQLLLLDRRMLDPRR